MKKQSSVALYLLFVVVFY